MNISFEGNEEKNKVYMQDYFESFDDTPIDFNRRVVIFTGQAVESKQNKILTHQRQGSELAAHIFYKAFAKSPLILSQKSLEENQYINYWDQWELNPLQNFDKEIFESNFIEKLLTHIGLKKEQKHFLFNITGTIDFAFQNIKQYQDYFKSSQKVVKLSPLLWNQFSSGQEVLHLGLDHKSNQEQGQNVVYYDIEQGYQNQIEILSSNLEEKEKIIVIIDCKVLSSEYFHGADLPFPFSYTKKDLMRILRELKKYEITFLQFTNYNPNIENKISSVFLLNLVYELLNQ